MMMFEDRTDAGRRLGRALMAYEGRAPLVLGLPRGGVPVAFEIAEALDAPLDVWIVRKLGVPEQPELGMGAVSEGPAVVLDDEVIEALDLGPQEVMDVVHREAAEVRSRIALYRGGEAPPALAGHTVIVVDDGVATGGTIRAALKGLRKRGAERIVLAVPLASPIAVARLRPLVDDLVCLTRPPLLFAIGEWYEDFRPVPDQQVLGLLGLARRRVAAAGPGIPPLHAGDAGHPR